MYLMAPLQQAHIFLSVVKKQMKKNKKNTANVYLNYNYTCKWYIYQFYKKKKLMKQAITQPTDLEEEAET